MDVATPATRGHATGIPGEAAAGSGPAAVRPLEGTVVRALGDSVALRVAVRRLRALGCGVEPGEEPPPDDAPAGRLCVTRVPFSAATGALPECRIGWSGPVAVPMSGESDVQAACGIMEVHGRATGGPRPLPVDYLSVCAGVLAVQAVTAGVLALLRDGPPLVARTSAAQAALLALTQHIAVATAEPDSDPPAAGCPSSGPAATRTPPFDSADGVRFEIDTFDAEDWRRFWAELGAAPVAAAAGWPPFQRRFGTAICPLPAELAAVTAALDYRTIRRAAGRSGVSVVPVRGAGASSPPAGESPWRLSGRAADHPAPPLPPLGPCRVSPAGHRAGPAVNQVSSAGHRAGPGVNRAPLAGLRVLEATSRVQGPLAGHLLGQLGAEVVRLEPPGGDPMRGVPPMAGPCSARFQALNRGKRAVEADLKSAQGRRAALRLAAAADVFLHNWPPGRAARLRLDHDDLAVVRPALVYAHAGGWADLLPPPQPLGTDYLVQAYCGVAALAVAPGERPAPSLLTLTDVLGGLICAEGVVAALLARARTGVGVRVETALADAARLIVDTAYPTCPAAGGVSGRAPVVTDLAVPAADPAYHAALDITGAAVYSGPPWTFVPAPDSLPMEAAR
ncbi:CoA transferase [Sphaerimonospora sp. CA-214678]|uniref:CoA transferase n=1 Tax=Sphaerimonospora sp. CA-214678 TaxID=3240029 RepID=UPI003D947F13